METNKGAKSLSLLLAAGALIGTSPAEASRPDFSIKFGQVKEVTVASEHLIALGLAGPMSNDQGQIRDLLQGELLKVRIHEEIGVLDFTSFDGYTRVVGVQSSTPRNLI